jgi:hypothetical protein
VREHSEGTGRAQGERVVREYGVSRPALLNELSMLPVPQALPAALLLGPTMISPLGLFHRRCKMELRTECAISSALLALGRGIATTERSLLCLTHTHVRGHTV